MMSESGDDNNGDSAFEIINAGPEIPGGAPGSDASVRSMLRDPAPTIPPPSSLPAFALMPQQHQQQQQQQQHQPPPPTPPIVPSPVGAGNPYSIRSVNPSGGFQHHQPSVPPPSLPSMMIPSQPNPMEMPSEASIPPVPDTPTQQGSVPSSSVVGLEMPFEPTPPMHAGPAGGANSGVWGWFRGAVKDSPLLSKVAETARSSMDNMITMLDPQMKEYMNASGAVDVVTSLDRDDEMQGVRDGASRFFTLFNIRPFVVMAGSFNSAVLPIGFSQAIDVAQQKVGHIRNSGYVDQNSIVIGSEGCLVEASPGSWLYFDCLVLNDAVRHLQLSAFTQPVPVPNEIVELLKSHTGDAYPYRNSGFALSMSQALTQQWSLTLADYEERSVGIPRRELLKNAVMGLFYSYRTRV